MPNHVTNKLVINGTPEQVTEVLEFIKAEHNPAIPEDSQVFGIGTIDFNKITPMPMWVYGSSPRVMGIGLEDEEKYGRENTSLEWCRNNWGTKWNAYNLSEGLIDKAIYFDTAWNGVPELIKKIAWIFPKVEIEYSYADEDFGCNVGWFKFKDTEVEKDIPVNMSKAAYELAKSIKGYLPEYYVFNEELDNYEYMEESE